MFKKPNLTPLVFIANVYRSYFAK